MGKVVFIAEKLLAGVKKRISPYKGCPFFKGVEVKPMLKKSYKFIKAFWSKIAIKLTQNLHKSEKSDILILKCTEGVEVANFGLSPNLFF